MFSIQWLNAAVELRSILTGNLFHTFATGSQKKTMSELFIYCYCRTASKLIQWLSICTVLHETVTWFCLSGIADDKWYIWWANCWLNKALTIALHYAVVVSSLWLTSWRWLFATDGGAIFLFKQHRVTVLHRWWWQWPVVTACQCGFIMVKQYWHVINMSASSIYQS